MGHNPVQKRAISLLLAVQATLVAGLCVYISLADGLMAALTTLLAGGIYLGLLGAYLRGVEVARHLTVVLITLLLVLRLDEPYLTRIPPMVLLVPPVLALVLTSNAWVLGVSVFQVAALHLRTDGNFAGSQPIQLTIYVMIVATLVLGRHVMESALAQAETARAEAERRMREVEEARARATSLEEELRHAQRMESLGRLAGGVAHDFNNLLTVMDGSAALAGESLPAEHPARQDLVVVQDAAQRAAELTRQLLAFARRQVLAKRVLDAGEACRALERMLTRLLGERVTLRTDIPDEPLWVNADPAQLEQVVMNLVLNARDAMPDGGTVHLRVRASSLPGVHHGDGPGVRIDVVDTGVGMSEDVRARVFEPFFTTKGLGRGTGLGLATTFGIIKQHDGHIVIESTPGRGSTFSVYLPRAPAAPQPNVTAAPARAAPRPARVLLVEDDAAVRGVTTRMLQDAGYVVDALESAEAALPALERHPPDVLVSDVVMPGMGGVELARRARQAHPDLGVVLVSGYADALLSVPALPGRPVEFLQKPFTPAALAAAVQRVLPGTPALEQATG